MVILFLSLDEVLEIHDDQIRRHGGAAGTRELGLVQSALAMPRAGGPAGYYHTDLCEMAAAYLYYIVRNHPFVDGNKRTGVAAALVFLQMNGIEIRVTDDELVDVVLAAADGTLGKSSIAEFEQSSGGRRFKSGRPDQ